MLVSQRQAESTLAQKQTKAEQRDSGGFSIVHTFAKADKYKMWIDAKPKGGIQILTAFLLSMLKVSQFTTLLTILHPTGCS
ncbi:MAG TPA: hypothetical protein VJ643_02560 [Nitrososphaera sp.]|nr:hypothetical protein [Nitrososphaera sp.]